MTIAHKNLTGTDLHEMKGAAAATSGQVPVANGAGGTVFQKLTSASLDSTANPFGAGLVYVHETQPAGNVSADAGGTGSYVTTPLNTVGNNDITGASLASNTITLPAGTYFIEATVPWLGSTGGAIKSMTSRLFNLSTIATVIQGTTVRLFGASNNASLVSRIVGKFTIVTSTVLSIQHYKESGTIGSPGGLGGEVYTQVLIWKVS